MFIDYRSPLARIMLSKPMKPLARILGKICRRLSGRRIRIRFMDVDVGRSKAFMPSTSSYGVVVKERVLISDVVRLLKGVDGIRSVYTREEIFKGPYLDRFPEIYFEPSFDRGYYVITSKITNAIIRDMKTLGHHPLGVFIIHGVEPNSIIKPWETIQNYVPANIILTLLNAPISHVADGASYVEHVLGVRPKLYNYIVKWRVLKRVRLVL